MSRDNFVDRHIGPSDEDINFMLKEIGENSIDNFIGKVVPYNIAIKESLSKSLPDPLSEIEVIGELKSLASKNKEVKSLIGIGYYGTHVPPVILRNVLENPAWYTAYTPYQPEISQGRLEALFAFQTVVCDLTGLPISNASMLDEASAAAESMTLAKRTFKGNDDLAFGVDENLHPHIKAVIETRAKPLKIKLEYFNSVNVDGTFISKVYGFIVSQFASNGEFIDHSKLIGSIGDSGVISVAQIDLLAAALYKSAGEYGFDVAIGSAQRFGVPMGFGGPHAGFMAVKSGLERSLPGRLVGQSVDSHGNPALRLALQTREQHIRRDKATSNICTAQVLLAVMSGLYSMWHGADGIKKIAERVQTQTVTLRDSLKAGGVNVPTGNIFDTFTVGGVDSNAILNKALASGFNLRKIDAQTVGISFDETVNDVEVAELISIFGGKRTEGKISNPVARTSKYLTHYLFNSYHSETGMLRYLRNLADRDLALDRSMIPLGSCTMKLNATTEMIPVTWPEFSTLHPFAPADQSTGSRQLIRELSDWLVAITGYDAVSLQPNAGSQGEFAGLLAIRGYLDANNGKDRDICLIPSSAHGTNAASAVMAGMQVVVVACDEDGNVSVDDLKTKIAENASKIAALMVTYPSTHGVFEEAISEICALVHDAGGQVYVDGANLNALVGLSQPGKFGADVSHLNLHKTFCIPHGGGGPGVGPVISRAHLAPYLPNHPLDELCGPATGPGPVSSAPFGSASILPISWTYIRMMGGEGLTKATQVAILSANYLASKLDSQYPVLYKGKNGYVAHECIIDLRQLTKETGVTVEDVAKRLMDYGFHAPTVSFPVAGTLMIEPTESEDLVELDRFLAAMSSIRAEIADVAAGKYAIEESPLRGAPHISSEVLSDNWDKKYSRQVAALPTETTFEMGAKGKYWPTVGRIDGVYGDRNLVCACPPIESYA
jgi:glycine dehydrogenase